jgi:hypothetical protein
MYTLCYFLGLLMFAVAFGVHTNHPPYGFMIVGGGLILYPFFTLALYPMIQRFTRRH